MNDSEDGSKILIVDDDMDMELYFTGFFSKDNVEISFTTEPKDAVERVREEVFDLVISDLKMPGMDGIELSKRIRKIDQDVPIIITSAYATIGASIDAIREKVDDFIRKPFDKEDLRTAIDKALKKKEIIKENRRLRKRIQQLGEAERINIFYQKVAESLQETEDLDKLLDNFVKIICDVMDVKKCSIEMFSEEEESWEMLSIDRDRIFSLKEKSRKRYSKIDKLIHKEKKPILVEDIEKDERFQEMQSSGNYETKSFLIIPLKIRDKIIGKLNLTDRVDGEIFTVHDLNIFTILANQISFSIQNLSMYQKLIYSEKIQREVEIANQLQLLMLPHDLPRKGLIRVGVKIVPAKVMAGDFYDIIPIDEENIGIAIGDVAGKGIPAAFQVMRILTLLRTEEKRALFPGKVLERINKQITRQKIPKIHATIFYGIINLKTKRLRYSSAGHEFPLLFRKKENKFEELKAGDQFLGIFENIQFEEKLIQLGRGDTICLYTDGVVNTINEKNEPFRAQRLPDLLSKYSDRSPQFLVDSIFEELDKYRGSVPRQDDMVIFIISMGREMHTKKIKIKIPPKMEKFSEVLNKTNKIANELNFSVSEMKDIEYSMSEVIHNAIDHSHKHNIEKDIEIEYVSKEDKLDIYVKDKGGGFDVEAFEMDESRFEVESFFSGRGRGIQIIKALMDEVKIESEVGEGSTVIMTKFRKQ